ncbi:MAG: hypothetical protein LAT64_04055 [Phycisphaerales bacterium]|nr:hypothetical protein [Planctomycetota bacterium]MCH8507926.1 hypothetical protein [Phycisphaerales bacterium]
MKAKNALSLLLAAGMVTPAIASDRTPQTFHRAPVAGAQVVGHVYFNIATGEKIVNYTNAKSQVAPRGTDPEVWVTDNNVPCADIDPVLYAGGFVGVVDDPADVGDPDFGDIAFNAEYLDWGDVPPDTVIDGVSGSWWTEHADPDEEGVEGFAATWSFYEGENGFNSCLTRTGIVAFTLFNLFGDPDPGAPGIRGWRFTVDLTDFGDADLSFEIGDTDGDPQSAAIHNPFFFVTDTSGDGFPDGDLDGDGLADFGHSLSYIQPGTVDFNGDGTPDGDPTNVARTFIDLVAPRGSVDPTTGAFTMDDSFPGGSAGSEDAFDILYEPFPDFTLTFGTFWYGGFTCDANGNGIFEGDYRPWSAFGISLLGPDGDTGPGGCPVDLNGDGLVNFFDIQIFLAAFNAGDASIADWNNDGLINFFDIQLYLADFNAGCP